MREISKTIREARIKGLENLIASYRKALKKATSEDAKRSIKVLLEKAEKDLEDMK